jgi:hypothetical protein
LNLVLVLTRISSGLGIAFLALSQIGQRGRSSELGNDDSAKSILRALLGKVSWKSKIQI